MPGKNSDCNRICILPLAGCSSKTASESSGAADTSTAAAASTDGQGVSESGDTLETITIRSCFTTGMTGAVNNFAIEKGLYKELGIEFENYQAEDIPSETDRRNSASG